MKWAFIGSGPSAPAQVKTILPRLNPCRSISCNAAIKLLTPDVYFLADQVACRRYSHLAKAAKESGDIHLVTMHRYRQALEARNVHWFDEFLINGVDPPLPNRWGAYNMSGAICLEYACRHGATELHLLGCEGYTDTVSYFDQNDRCTEFKIADSETTKQLVNRTTMVVECFPAVQFYVYGPTHYTIPLPNWHEQIAD
jgi:hypothetical protein